MPDDPQSNKVEHVTSLSVYDMEIKYFHLLVHMKVRIWWLIEKTKDED